MRDRFVGCQLFTAFSFYLLDGSARDAWHITPGDQLRYSVTFRTLRQPAL